MPALVVYESMYGNTPAMAEAIGAGLGERDGGSSQRNRASMMACTVPSAC